MEHSDASCDTMTTAHSEEDDMHGIPPQPDCGSGPKSGSLLSNPPSRTTNLRRRCDGEPPPTTVNHGNWTHDMRLRPKAIPGHIAMSEPLSGLRADTGTRTRVFSLGSASGLIASHLRVRHFAWSGQGSYRPVVVRCCAVLHRVVCSSRHGLGTPTVCSVGGQ